MCENRRCSGPHRVGVKTYKGESEQTGGITTSLRPFPTKPFHDLSHMLPKACDAIGSWKRRKKVT
jgi:hypothetical protein